MGSCVEWLLREMWDGSAAGRSRRSLAAFPSHEKDPLEPALLGKAPWELVSQERAKLEKRIRKLRRWEGFLSMGHVYQRLQSKAERNRKRIHILV